MSKINFNKLLITLICVLMVSTIFYYDPLTQNKEDFNEENIIEKDNIGIFEKPSEDDQTTKDNYPPTLLAPYDSAYLKTNTPYLDWSDVPDANLYQVQVSRYSDFSTTYVDEERPSTSSYYYSGMSLPEGLKYWRVRTRHQVILNFWGAWSAANIFTIDTIPPSKVYLSYPSNGLETKTSPLNFGWNSVTGAYRYEIQIDNNYDFSSPVVDYNNVIGTSASYSLSPNRYYWHIRARDQAGNTGLWSDTWTVTYDTTPPSAPVLTSPSNGYQTNIDDITLRWSDAPDAVQNELFLAYDPGFTSLKLHAYTSATSYALANLVDDTYYWRVRSKDQAGNWGSYSVTWSFLIDDTPPGTPSLYSPSSGTFLNSVTPTLKWNPVSTATLYELQVSDTTTFDSCVYSTQTGAITATVTTLTDDTYYWRVKARDALNNWGSWSATWNFVIDTIGPETPIPSTPSDGYITSDNTPYFAWSSISDAYSYRLETSLSPSFSSYATFHTTNCFFTIPTYEDYQFYWRVRARDIAGNWGSPSAGRMFIIDTTAPSIFDVVDDGALADDTNSITIYCNVSDANIVDQVLLYYRVNSGSWTSSAMTWTNDDQYEATIGTFDYADVIEYYITAIDNAVTPNTGTNDNGGLYFGFTINSSDNSGPTITNVNHYPASPTETNSIVIDCNVEDPNGVQQVDLYYRINGGTWTSVTMTLDWGTRYFYDIGSYTYGTSIEYYINATDNYVLHNIAIDDNTGAYYSFLVNPSDVTGPTITDVIHSPSNPTDTDSVTISCSVTDVNGIQSVTLYYRVNLGIWVEVGMTLESGSNYELDIGSFAFDDFIEYFVVAVDDYATHNTAVEDNDGACYNVTIEASDVTGPTITDITHSPSSPIDTDSITISCSVTDVNGIQSVTLYYRINSGTWVEVTMTRTVGITYEATIGAFAYDNLIEYYIEAIDDYVLHNSAMDDNLGLYYGFIIGASDATGPTIADIEHTPNNPTDVDSVTISCTVFDDSGIDFVTLVYRIDGGDWIYVNMTKDSTTGYIHTIGIFANDVVIEYYIVAFDAYVASNCAINDNGGLYYSFTIDVSDTTGPTIEDITNDPITPTDLETVAISCTVSDPNGIDSVTLYYRINGGSWVSIAMINTVDDTYAVTIGAFDYADFVEYYVVAVDGYVVPNTATNDNSGTYYNFTIVSGDVIAPSIEEVEHNPASPTELDTVTINCTAIDAAGIDSVTLYYRINGGTWTSIVMVHTTGSEYEVTIGAFLYDDLVEYYIVAVDTSPNSNEATENNGGVFYNFTIVSSDTTAPVIDDITHSPIAPHDMDSITISCIVTDGYSLQSVTLYYRIDDGSWVDVSMTLTSGRYQATIGAFAYGELIEYYIVAIDASPVHNESIDNNSGSYYSFTIASSDNTGPTITDITHTPNPSDADSVNITCIVTDSNGVQGVTLYYRVDGGAWISASMTVLSGNIYGATIGSFNASATIQYYITATDDSPNHNPTTDDNLGVYYSFTVTAAPTSNTSLLYILPFIALLGLAIIKRKKD